MSREFIFKWVIIAVTIATAAVLIVAQGLVFPAGDLWIPLAVAAALATAAWLYRIRGEEKVVTALTALMFLASYAVCFTVMMSAGAALGRPLFDQTLSRLDSLCGIRVPDIMQWAQSRPLVGGALALSYDSLLWQTPLVIVVLGYTGDLKQLRLLVLHLMLGAWICAIFFFVFPAAGPYSIYGFELSAAQAQYVQHFQELRNGLQTVVTWRGADWLIMFPSFHVAWALLLAWSVRRRTWLFLPILLVNAAAIVAAMTTGWHYFSDVLAGAFVGVFTVCLANTRTSEAHVEQVDRDSMVSQWLTEHRAESRARVRSVTGKYPKPVEREPVPVYTKPKGARIRPPRIALPRVFQPVAEFFREMGRLWEINE